MRMFVHCLCYLMMCWGGGAVFTVWFWLTFLYHWEGFAALGIIRIRKVIFCFNPLSPCTYVRHVGSM